MKAMILAGGYGKRLKPITDTIPKPLISVAGKPIIEWQILWMKNYGISEFVVLTGHLSHKLISYLKANQSRLNVNIDFTIENQPLGTGGAIKKAQKAVELDKTFIVANGDVISNFNISKIKPSKDKIASISLAQLRSQYGIVKSKGSKVTEFKEKPVLPEYWTSIGIYLLSNKIFNYLPEKGDIEKLFPKLAELGLMKCTKFKGCYFRTIDSHKDIGDVSADIAAKKVY